MSNFLAEFNCGGGCMDPSNPEQVYMDMLSKRGDFNQYFSKDIIDGGQNKFLQLFSRTRRQMRVNGSDTEKQIIERITSPDETSVFEWEKLGDTLGGAEPCCNTPEKIELLGSETVSACLFRKSYISDPFCKEELAFKWDSSRQNERIVRSMQRYTQKIWEHWAIYAYVSNVNCTIISKSFGNPTQRGAYPAQAGVVPTSRLTMGYVEKYIDEMEDASIETPISTIGNYQWTIFTSRQSIKHLLDDYRADLAAASPSYRTNEKPMNIYIDELGNAMMTAIGPYLFCAIRRPRKFNERANGQAWLDALVPSTVNVPAQFGKKSIVNPLWNAAKYEETIFYNEAALEWLIPPDQLTEGNVLHTNPTNYAGNVLPISPQYGTDCHDPQSKFVRLFAEFGSGVLGRCPDFGRACLHLAPGFCVDDVDVCKDEVEVENCTPVRVECSTIDGALTLITPDPIQTTLPAGFSLYLKTQKGKYQLISSVAGPGILDPKTNKYHTTVTLPDGDFNNAGLRECDPWESICVIDPSNAGEAAQSSDCGTCLKTEPSDTDVDGDGVIDTAQCIAEFATNQILTIEIGGTSITIPAGSDETAIQALIQAELDSIGNGGTAEVVYDAMFQAYTITITGHDSTALDLSTAKVTFEKVGAANGEVLFSCVVPV